MTSHAPSGSPIDRERMLELQKLLLPVDLPQVGCTELAAAYRAHNHELKLGGDWFDLIDRHHSNSVVAVVGDVVGHGIRQISAMGQLRAASNAVAHSVDSAGSILAGLDRFAVNVPGAAFATVAVLILDGTETARLVCAGHPPPLLIKADGSSTMLEMGRRGPLTLGGEIVEGTFDYSIGDLIIMYTDGVVERRGDVIDDGISALAQFVAERRELPCTEIVAAVVDDFASDADDDRAVLILRPLHERGERYQLTDRTSPSVSII